MNDNSDVPAPDPIYQQLQALFRNAFAQLGLRKIEIIRLAGASLRAEPKMLRAFDAVMAGRGGEWSRIERLGKALGLDARAVWQACDDDENAWKDWAMVPITPKSFAENMLGLIVFHHHQVPPEMSRDEVLAWAKSIAIAHKHKVFVPALRGMHVMFTKMAANRGLLRSARR